MLREITSGAQRDHVAPGGAFSQTNARGRLPGEVDLRVGSEQGLTNSMCATQKTLGIIGCGERKSIIFFEQLIHELTFPHQKHHKFACGIDRRTPYFALVFGKVLLAPGFNLLQGPPPRMGPPPLEGPIETPAALAASCSA